ncbi:MAG: hypothetical protein A2340_14645 [Lentisphaerae bacterium RIFOXYB12_FULL_60_10]|nr:MAG: hypothetical protein A2340_14645 [Lentisphaerae bacterium RIFOXYB12_FULL_60_10]
MSAPGVLVIAAQFAEARPCHIGELHFGVLGSRGTFRALDDVLATAAGGLGHLVVLPPFRIVEFRIQFLVIEGQETAAEPQCLNLHERCQREGMQTPETSVLIEQIRHRRLLLGAWGTLLSPLAKLTTQACRA